MKSVFIALGAMLLAPVVHAQAVDASFALNGQFTLELNDASSASQQLIRQPDGKIVSLAVSPAGDGVIESRNIVVTRLNSDGLPDTTFGTNGFVFIDLAGRDDRASHIALQSDGKLVITGSTDVGAEDFDGFVLRLAPNGAFDTSFNGTGFLIVPLNVNGPDDNCNVIALRSDNTIFAVCSQFNFNSASLVRVNPQTGALETSFANRGILTPALPAFFQTRPAGIVVDPISGAITIAATRLDDRDSPLNIVLNRFTTTGQIDQTFGLAGTSGFGVGGPLTPIQVSALLRDLQGRLVLAGLQEDRSVTPATVLPFIARLTPDGLSDGSFGGSGVLEVQATVGIAAATSLALQSDGKVLVAGFANRSMGTAGPVDPFVLRLTDEGRFDSTFATIGITRVTFSDSVPVNRVALSIAATAEGNILLGGTQDMGTAETQRAFVVQLVKRTIGFLSDFATVAEGAGSVQLTLMRSGDTSNAGSVRVLTSSGTATAGEDFTALDQLVTFAPGEVSTTISVPIAGDTLDEVDETFSITLTSPSEGSFIDAGTASVLITDDDEAVQPMPPATPEQPSPQPPQRRRGGGGALELDIVLLLGLLAFAAGVRRRAAKKVTS